MIEVSASHIDRSECLTYRKQSLNVTSTLRPHFNPITITDGTDEIAVMLENNDIYKYPRPSGNQYLEVEVLHGHTCNYKVNEDDKTEFTCSSGSINISLDSGTACDESTIELWASGGEDEEESEQEKRTYYNFCPEGSDYCYLGPGDERQSYHLCSRDIASESSEGNVARTSFEVDPANGRCGEAENACQIGNLTDLADTDTHYKWQCVGIGSGATADCEKFIPISGVCDNSVRNGCGAGEANDEAIADTTTHYTWACEGLHDGSTANDCQIRKPINGVCDNSQRNACSTGDSDDAAIVDTPTHYRWHCKGLYEGTTATDCQRELPPQPVNGVCNNSKRNGCSTGDSNDAVIADTNTYYTWHCVGQHGGSTATGCQIRKPINGVCNNNQKYSCSTGTSNASAIADTSTLYKWHCVGKHGGNTARNCQKAIPVNGACDNSKRNGCSTGDSNDAAIVDTNTYYRWHCVGQHGGSTATGCQIRKPINGVCNNNQKYSCSTGTSNASAIADTNTFYKWHCEGLHGGTAATNCQIRKPINGACNNSQRNACSAGDSDDAAVADTATLYKWHCVGEHGGTTARNCQKAIPINGVCDNNQRNSCSAGTANDAAIADTNTLYKWHCVGLNGGTTVRNCQKAIPINGVCDNSKQNGCTTGTPSDAAADDTSTHYKWYCLGSNGGTIATDCEKAKPVNGICDNTRRNGCSAGTANASAIADTNTLYKWHCEGLHGGATVTDCEKTRSTDGACDNSRINRCRNGTTLNDIDDTDTLYKWQCVGLNGGRTLTCSKSKADCSFHKYFCDEGSEEDTGEGSPVPPVPESGEATHYTCPCVSDDRKAVASCRTLKKTAWCGGDVGAIEGKDVDVYLVRINTCLIGTPSDITDTEDMHKWKCDWYESVAFCSVVKHAECRPSSVKLCNNGATRTSYSQEAGTWNCAGGTTSVSCSRDE